MKIHMELEEKIARFKNVEACVVFQSGFTASEKRYSGTMSYHNGRVVMENFNPMLHDLEAKFNATPTAFTLESATLTSGQSRFELTATVQDYSNPHATAQYNAVVDAGDTVQDAHPAP